MNKRLFALTLSAVLALGCAGCSLLPREEARRASPVVRADERETYETVYANVGDMALTRKLSCTYMPVEEVSLYFGVEGEAPGEMYVKAGDTVTKGQLLGELYMEDVDGRIRQCERTIERTRMDMEYAEKLYELDVREAQLSDPEDSGEPDAALERLEAARKTQLQSYEDTLSVQQMRLDSLTESREARRIYSPMDGTVTYVRKYTKGALSSTTEKAVVVSDSTRGVFSVDTELWECLPVGTPVTVTVSRVEYETVVTDAQSLGIGDSGPKGKKRTVYLELLTPAVDLESNDRGSFVVTIETRTNVLRISEKAVSKANDDYIVYYLTDEGIRSYKKVSLGLNAEGWYEVLDGLKEGEGVIAG